MAACHEQVTKGSSKPLQPAACCSPAQHAVQTAAAMLGCGAPEQCMWPSYDSLPICPSQGLSHLLDHARSAASIFLLHSFSAFWCRLLQSLSVATRCWASASAGKGSWYLRGPILQACCVPIFICSLHVLGNHACDEVQHAISRQAGTTTPPVGWSILGWKNHVCMYKLQHSSAQVCACQTGLHMQLHAHLPL